MKGQARLYGSQEHQGKRQKFSSEPRSRLSLAISRMAEVLDLDLLEAALGVSARALQDILSGRGKDQESRYATHLSHHLEAAGIPFSWLNDPAAPLSSEHQASLLELAALSGKKSALRRHNFKKLVKAFEGRLDVLADALEILEPSVSEIATGALPFEDQRFGHINPRLVAAGLPDGWLENPEAAVTPDLVDLLNKQAVAYEQSSSSQDEPSDYYAAPSKPAVAQNAEFNAYGGDAVDVEQVSDQPGAIAKEVSPNETVVIDKEITMKTQPRGAKATVAPTPSQKEFKAAGIPGLAGATLPMQPRADGVKPAIPRGALATGRTLGKTLSAAPRTSAKTATLSPSAEKPASKQAKQPKAIAGTQSHTPMATSDTEIREISMRRADALEKLLDSARRGAKVTLWRDMLKSSLGYWGNIRRSQVFLRDQLANDITTALGLPQGWLDNPVFPPPTIADWVMNADVPLPGKAAPAPSATKASRPTEATVKPSRGDGRSPQPRVDTQVSAQAPVVLPAEPAPVQQAAPTATGVGVDWQPAATAQPVEKLGPIVTALVSVIQDLGLQGKLTEQEALKLLNGFMSKS